MSSVSNNRAVNSFMGLIDAVKEDLKDNKNVILSSMENLYTLLNWGSEESAEVKEQDPEKVKASLLAAVRLSGEAIRTAQSRLPALQSQFEKMVKLGNALSERMTPSASEKCDGIYLKCTGYLRLMKESRSFRDQISAELEGGKDPAPNALLTQLEMKVTKLEQQFDEVIAKGGNPTKFIFQERKDGKPPKLVRYTLQGLKFARIEVASLDSKQASNLISIFRAFDSKASPLHMLLQIEHILDHLTAGTEEAFKVALADFQELKTDGFTIPGNQKVTVADRIYFYLYHAVKKDDPRNENLSNPCFGSEAFEGKIQIKPEQRLQAVQRAAAELIYSLLYKMIDEEIPYPVSGLIKKLEGITFSEGDAVKNAAYATFGELWNIYSKAARGNPELQPRPDAKGFGSDFGRHAFANDVPGLEIDKKYRLEALASVYQKLLKSWTA